MKKLNIRLVYKLEEIHDQLTVVFDDSFLGDIPTIQKNIKAVIRALKKSNS